MRTILRLVIFAFVVFIILKVSTFGWRFWSSSFVDSGEKNVQVIEKLKQHVYELSHEIGERSLFKYEKLNETAGYITDQFRAFGYNVEFQKYTVSNKRVENIIATKVGLKNPEEIIIVGAHYDSCFNPGADDNASGIAGVLELARMVSNQQVNRSIKFIAFVNEEPPFFKTENMGSRVYAKNAKIKGENIKAVIILETIGFYIDKPYSQRYPPILGLFYPNKANFIAVVGNFSSHGLVRKVVSAFRQKTQFPIESILAFASVPGIDFSDHWSFWQEGYPAVMITDTAFYRSPNYHKASDTYEKLNYQNMSEVIKGISGVLLSRTID